MRLLTYIELFRCKIGMYQIVCLMAFLDFISNISYKKIYNVGNTCSCNVILSVFISLRHQVKLFKYFSSASFPTFLWGWCVLWDASIYTGLTRPPVTILSPQVVPDVIQPHPLWSSSPSFPRHFHPHISLSCLRIRRPYHFNQLSCTLLDISSTFVVPLILPFLILFTIN